MNLTQRIESFEMLGDRLRRYSDNSTEADIMPLAEAARLASAFNPWFTPGHISVALNNLGALLTPGNLNRWLIPYRDRIEQVSVQKTIGVVMAGNIPAVGFHDFLCVLISGHKLLAKLSSSDDRLLPAMADILIELFPEWQENITFTTG